MDVTKEMGINDVSLQQVASKHAPLSHQSLVEWVLCVFSRVRLSATDTRESSSVTATDPALFHMPFPMDM